MSSIVRSALVLLLAALLAACTTARPSPAKIESLINPAPASERAPDTYTVKLQTTKGVVLIDVTRAWAPLGADRFYTLVRRGFYDDVAFFRTIVGFMAQVGIHGDPSVNAVWSEAKFPDDPVTQSNTYGMVSFATAGPGTRTTQVFINYMDNSRLDGMGFAPFGLVRDMKVPEKFWGGYGEGAPMGKGPGQNRIQDEGNAYLRADFPKLDYIIKATIVR